MTAVLGVLFFYENRRKSAQVHSKATKVQLISHPRIFQPNQSPYHHDNDDGSMTSHSCHELRMDEFSQELAMMSKTVHGHISTLQKMKTRCQNGDMKLTDYFALDDDIFRNDIRVDRYCKSVLVTSFSLPLLSNINS